MGKHKNTLFSLLLFSLTLSCGAPQGGGQAPAAGAGANGASSDAFEGVDTSGLSQGQLSEMQQLLGSFENEIGWPARPRRQTTITDTMSNTTVFSVGLNFNLFGSELKNTISPKFSMSLKTVIMLVRTSKEGIEPIMIDDEEGLRLNFEPGVDFVYFCTYSASATAGLVWEAKVGIFGNGLGNTAEISESIEANQGSQFLKVTQDDTLSSIKRTCREQFVGAVKDSVIRDLKTSIKASVGFNETAGSTPIEEAAKAAKDGPEKKDVIFQGVTFNVPQAEIIKEGDRYTIRGKVVRHRKLVGPIPSSGLDIHYDYTFKDGIIIRKGGTQDAGEEIGIKLGQMLAEDVYLNSREAYEGPEE